LEALAMGGAYNVGDEYAARCQLGSGSAATQTALSSNKRKTLQALLAKRCPAGAQITGAWLGNEYAASAQT
jgi:hypothetical protein